MNINRRFSVAINQHLETNAAESKADVMALEITIKICTAGTIVIVDEQRCSTASRAWCLFTPSVYTDLMVCS